MNVNIAVIKTTQPGDIASAERVFYSIFQKPLVYHNALIILIMADVKTGWG